MPISDVTRDEAQRLARRYPVARSALLPMLHLVQSDEGYVSEDGIGLCAEVLGLTKAEVGAVATFYTMYKREPFGDYLLSVCTNPTCQLAGGQAIYDAYVEACGPTHVDRDGAGVMVEHAECLGICDAAPVVQINYEMYGPVTHEEAVDMLARARSGEPPASNLSAETPATFRAVERELSGIDDGLDEYLVAAARRQATSANPPAYRTGETDIPVTHPGGDPAGHGGEAFRTTSGFRFTAEEPSETDPGDDAEVAEEIAEGGAGVEQELAEQVTDEQPARPTPSTARKPETAGGHVPAEGPTPDESAGHVAAGAAAEPDDAVGGGAPDVEQPVGDADTPSEDESLPGDDEEA